MSASRIGAMAGAFVLGLASLGLGWWANASIRLGLLVGHTPVSWAAAVLPGATAVQGRVGDRAGALEGPFSGSPCVYYRKLVEREERDSDGDTSWKTVEDTSRRIPFHVQDVSGSLPIDPAGAEIRAPQVHQHRQGDIRYTDLQANELVLQLQRRLAGLENEIAFCRQSYNDAVQRYNARIETLPDLLIAVSLRIPPRTIPHTSCESALGPLAGYERYAYAETTRPRIGGLMTPYLDLCDLCLQPIRLRVLPVQVRPRELSVARVVIIDFGSG